MVPLTPAGQANCALQGVKLLRWLQEQDPMFQLYVFTSPYKRTLDTCQLMFDGVAQQRVTGYQVTGPSSGYVPQSDFWS